MTYCKKISDFYGTGGVGRILLLPEMLGYSNERSFPPRESFPYAISDYPSKSLTLHTLTPKDTQVRGDSVIYQVTSLKWGIRIWTQIGSKDYGLNPPLLPAWCLSRLLLKSDFTFRLTLSFHPGFLSREWGFNSGVFVIINDISYKRLYQSLKSLIPGPWDSQWVLQWMDQPLSPNEAVYKNVSSVSVEK